MFFCPAGRRWCRCRRCRPFPGPRSVSFLYESQAPTSKMAARLSPARHSAPLRAPAGQARTHSMHLPQPLFSVGAPGVRGASVKTVPNRTQGPWRLVTSWQCRPIQPRPARVGRGLVGGIRPGFFPAVDYKGGRDLPGLVARALKLPGQFRAKGVQPLIHLFIKRRIYPAWGRHEAPPITAGSICMINDTAR